MLQYFHEDGLPEAGNHFIGKVVFPANTNAIALNRAPNAGSAGGWYLTGVRLCKPGCIAEFREYARL